MISFTTTISEGELVLAMIDVANDLHDAITADGGRDTVTPTDTDVVAALREPVSMASAFADLCARLGIAPPEAIRRALSEDE